MKRKGLSQILYLIIAASVLMMIAMVITFTATDTIGSVGGQSTNTACIDAIKGKCLASTTNAARIPMSTCIAQGQWVSGVTAYDTSSLSSTQTASATTSSNPAYADCSQY